MSAEAIERLKAEARRAIVEGKATKAITALRELERIEPNQPEWSRRIADIYKDMGKKYQGEEVLALARCADRFARIGQALKAIAVCKRILQIDPNHYQTQMRLAAFLQQERQESAEKRATESSSHRLTAPPVNWQGPPTASHAAIYAPLESLHDESSTHRFQRQTIDPGRFATEPPGMRPPTEPPGIYPSAPPRPTGSAPVRPSAPVESFSLAHRPAVWNPPAVRPVIDPLTKAHTVLPATPFFDALSPDSLVHLISRMGLVELQPGQVLFRQGDPGDAMYVVIDGAVGIFNEGPPRVFLSRLGEASFFGEIALVIDQPRSATAEALEPTRLLSIDRRTVASLIRAEPRVLATLQGFVTQRLVDGLFRTSAFFNAVPPAERPPVSSRFQFRELVANGRLMEQGQPTPGFFILVAGLLQVIRGQGSERVVVAALRPGDVVGVISLLRSTPACCTIMAQTKCLLLEVDRAGFGAILQQHPTLAEYLYKLAEERERAVNHLSRLLQDPFA